jgi:hypothetical protein
MTHESRADASSLIFIDHRKRKFRRSRSNDDVSPAADYAWPLNILSDGDQGKVVYEIGAQKKRLLGF